MHKIRKGSKVTFAYHARSMHRTYPLYGIVVGRGKGMWCGLIEVKWYDTHGCFMRKDNVHPTCLEKY